MVFSDFTKISKYFYDLFAVQNYDLLKDLVKKNNIVAKKNVRSDASISIRTGVIPFDDAIAGTDLYEAEMPEYSGFSCVIIIDSGKREASQDALNIVASISQRVRYILLQQDFKYFTNIAGIPVNILNLEENSDISIDDSKSEFVYQMFAITGIYKITIND